MLHIINEYTGNNNEDSVVFDTIFTFFPRKHLSLRGHVLFCRNIGQIGIHFWRELILGAYTELHNYTYIVVSASAASSSECVMSRTVLPAMPGVHSLSIILFLVAASRPRNGSSAIKKLAS